MIPNSYMSLEVFMKSSVHWESVSGVVRDLRGVVLNRARIRCISQASTESPGTKIRDKPCFDDGCRLALPTNKPRTFDGSPKNCVGLRPVSVRCVRTAIGYPLT